MHENSVGGIFGLEFHVMIHVLIRVPPNMEGKILGKGPEIECLLQQQGEEGEIFSASESEAGRGGSASECHADVDTGSLGHPAGLVEASKLPGPGGPVKR